MKRGTLILAGAALSLVLGAAAFGFSAVGMRAVTASAAPQPVTELAEAKPNLDDACSSATTYERLKTKLFDVALDVGDVEPEKLDLLAGSTVVRMEDPILKAKDEELGVTVCAGTFVVELPPGAEKAFDGKRRLEADIEYAAQVAADGSGIVYQLRGAEPITYRLAAFDLQGLPPLPAIEPQPALAAAEPILMPAELVPAAVVTPAPAADAKPIPVVPDAVDAPEPKKVVEPAAKPKSAAPRKVVLARKPEPVAKPKPAAPKKVQVAEKKPDRLKAAKAAVKVAEESKKAPVKLAALKKPVMLATKVKPAPKPVVKAKVTVRTAASAKTLSSNPAAKPVVKVAKAVPPKPVAKPPVKVAKAAAPKPVPVRKPSAPVVKASTTNFACGAGRPLSERLMCASPTLGAKERRMMGVYYSALDNADARTRRVLQETAGDFLAYRNNCRTEACLSGAFDERVAEIRDIMADGR